MAQRVPHGYKGYLAQDSQKRNTHTVSLLFRSLMRCRWRDTARNVRRCSWPFVLRLVKQVYVYRRLLLFADGCRGSCQISCQNVAYCHHFSVGKRGVLTTWDIRCKTRGKTVV